MATPATPTTTPGQEEAPATSSRDYLRRAHPGQESAQPPAPSEEQTPDGGEQLTAHQLIELAHPEPEPPGLGLTPEELQTAPAEVQEEMREVYRQIDEVFEKARVRVTRDMPEWKYVEMEIENPGSTLTRTLIAAEYAAAQAKKRLLSTPIGEYMDQAERYHREQEKRG